MSAPIRTAARRAAIVALLYAFALSGLLTGLASALHAAPASALAELCRVDASGEPAPGAPAPLGADCCAHACRTACAGAAVTAPARFADVAAIRRVEASAPGPVADARRAPPSPCEVPFGPRGPPAA